MAPGSADSASLETPPKRQTASQTANLERRHCSWNQRRAGGLGYRESPQLPLPTFSISKSPGRWRPFGTAEVHRISFQAILAYSRSPIPAPRWFGARFPVLAQVFSSDPSPILPPAPVVLPPTIHTIHSLSGSLPWAFRGHKVWKIRGKTAAAAEHGAGDGRHSPLDSLANPVYSASDGGSRTIMVAPLSLSRSAA